MAELIWPEPQETDLSTIAEQLGIWGDGLTGAGIPQSVVKTLLRAVLDAGGLMVAGRHWDYIDAIRDTVEAPGACTAIGHAGGFTAGDAALIGGTAVHGEDYDDTFEGTPVHVGAVLVPAVLAAAERDRLSGERLLCGLAAGGELACRMALVAPTAIHRAALHPTAVIGAMAAAFGVAVAMRLDAAKSAQAMGIAGSMASGIIEYLAEGTSTKRLHPGWAAQAGLRAAGLAAGGFSGPRTVFEGEHGFFRAFAHPSIERDFGKLTGNLGKCFQIESLAFKPYACGTMAQPFIDAAIRLRERIDDPSGIKTITAPTSEGIVHRLWEPMAEKTKPSTPYSAKFSIPFAIAAGLCEGKAGLKEFTPETIADPRLLEVAGKVVYEVDPNDPYPEDYIGRLRVRMKDGREFEASQPCLRGGRREPLNDAEIERKFRANAAFGGWSDEMADRFAEFSGRAFEADNFKRPCPIPRLKGRDMPHMPASDALSHIRVLDLTRVRSGPTAVRQLADWGADVIKIEQPASLEADGSLGAGRNTADWQNLQRNRRSLTLNLKDAQGKALFMRLVEKADVVVEKFQARRQRNAWASLTRA